MMSNSYWRQKASPIIAEVLMTTRDEKKGVRDKALRDAYPFGERRYHPYKIWLDEIKRQRYGRPSVGVVADDTRLAEWEAIYGKREA